MFIQPDDKLLFGAYSQADNSSLTEQVLFRLNNTALSTTDYFFNDNKIEIFPNPTTHFVTIKTLKNIDNIALFNNLGQQINSVKITNNTIDLSGFSSGIYFVKVNSNETFKIIKQ